MPALESERSSGMGNEVVISFGESRTFERL